MNGGIEVTDRHYNFVIVENALQEDPDVTIYDFAVYAALKYFSGQKTGEDGKVCCWPSMETIAEKSKCSRASAVRALKHLEYLGYISRQPRNDGKMKMTSVYVINGMKKNSQESLKKAQTEPTLGSDRTEGRLCLSHRTRSNELDPLNQNNTPLPPQRGEAEAGSPQQSPVLSEEQELSRELIDRINVEFAVSSPDRLREAMALWIATYGAGTTRREVISAICWNVEHGRKRKSAVAFIGGWLRRSVGKKASMSLKQDQRFRSHFYDFWKLWLCVGGLDDGKQGAMDVFERRFMSLPDDAARAKALDMLFSQLEKLSNSGRDPTYFGMAKNWLAAADLEG